MDPQEYENLGLEEELDPKTLKKYENLANGDIEKTGKESSVTVNMSEFECPLVPRVVNIVACVDYGCKLDLVKISTSVRNSEYNPKRFPAATVRLNQPKATGLTFKNGKTNIVGCKTIDNAYLSARMFGRLFRQLGFEVTLKTFSISNVVAVVDTKFPIHLESIASHPGHIKFATYNPEIFAGLIYRVANPKCTLMIFVTGKVIITGAQTHEDVAAAANFMYPFLLQFARKNNTTQE